MPLYFSVVKLIGLINAEALHFSQIWAFPLELEGRPSLIFYEQVKALFLYKRNFAALDLLG